MIALTAMAMKEDQEKILLAGCDAYIAKPLRYKQLYAAIDGLLATGQAAVTTAGNRDAGLAVQQAGSAS